MDLLHQKYEIAITSTNCVVWELELHNEKITFSQNMEELTGLSFPDNSSLPFICRALFSDFYYKIIMFEIENYRNGITEEIYVQAPLLPVENEKKWILLRGKGLKDSAGEMDSISGILMDVTLMKEKEEHITYLANHDYLTKLPNRMNFMGALEQELNHDEHGALLLFDIDNFKNINDTLGHMYGDKLLVQVAERLCSIIEPQMMVARIGGDEFLLLLRNIFEEESISQFITKIKTSFELPFLLDNSTNYIQFSIGISIYPKDSRNIEQLLMNADTAMYKVKQN